MKKKLIKFDSATYDYELSAANKDLNTYNKLLQEIQPLILAVNLTVDKALIANLLVNPKEFAFDVIIADNPINIGGVPVKRDVAIDWVAMPENWVKIINVINAFNSELQRTPVHKAPHSSFSDINRIGLDNLTFVDNGFALESQFVANLKERHSIYTQNDKQNKVHELILTIYDAYKELKELGVVGIPTLEGIGITYQTGMSETRVSFDPAAVLSRVK